MEHSLTFYWIRYHDLLPDGSIRMKATGWEGSEHWTGRITIPKDHPDIALWLWILKNNEQFAARLTDNNIDHLRKVFFRETAQ